MKMNTSNLMGRARVVLGSIVVAIGFSASAALNLGGAQNFAVFQTGGAGQNWNTSDTFVSGDVGIASAPNVSLGNLAVNGNVYSAYSQSKYDLSSIRNWTDAALGQNPTRLTTFGNTITYSDSALAAMAAAVELAENTAAGYAADQSLGDVTGSRTVTLGAANNINHPGTYVVNVGKLALNNNQVLLLDGTGLTPGANVIVNVSGQFSLNGGAIRLTGGLQASQVLINNTSTQAASITGGGIMYGTFLGDDLNAQFNNNSAAIYGSVIAGSIQFSSDFRVYGTGNEFVPVPEPTTMIAGALLLLPFGASTLRFVRRRRGA